MLRYGLDRKNYNALHDIQPTEYPKSTAQAVVELRARGYNATVPGLNYLLKVGTIIPPAGEGRSLRWYAGDLDRATEEYEAQKVFTPEHDVYHILNLDPRQAVEAYRKAKRANPELDESLLMLAIVAPGAPGSGLYARCEYRAPTAQQLAEWKKAVAAANREAAR